MYVCGPTVYGRIHVGNARPFVVFELMKRYLEWRGQPVTLVENITDVNDKIYTAAAAPGRAVGPSWPREMSRRLHRRHRPARPRPPRPRAAGDRDDGRDRRADRGADRRRARLRGGRRRLLRGAQLRRYGELVDQRPDELLRGRRVEPGEHKRDPLDFALWKANKPGRGHVRGTRRGGAGGRAGTSSARRWPSAAWAASSRVHGGGRDLIFPHHENEVAQSERGRAARSPRCGRTTACCG